MPAPETAHYKPTEIWTPGSEDFKFDDSIERAVRDMNRENPKHLIHDLKQKVERTQNGVQLAVLDGGRPQDYSPTEALVLFNPHANSATANMLVRAEFIRRAAKFADVRGEDGKLKPVVMLAAPGVRGSRLKLSGEERRQVKNGELGPAAKELLLAVSRKGIGKVALNGFSEGADLTLAGARAGYNANLDISSAAIGDPAGVEDRSGPPWA